MKPHITKHPKGWKCRLGWRQVVGRTAAEAYDRWAHCNATWWQTKNPNSFPTS